MDVKYNPAPPYNSPINLPLTYLIGFYVVKWFCTGNSTQNDSRMMVSSQQSRDFKHNLLPVPIYIQYNFKYKVTPPLTCMYGGQMLSHIFNSNIILKNLSWIRAAVFGYPDFWIAIVITNVAQSFAQTPSGQRDSTQAASRTLSESW